jgi:plastocyanin
MRSATAIALVATAFAGCGSGDAATPSAGAPGATRVQLDDDHFKPATISGTPGATARLELVNEGKAEHTFTVDGQKIDTELGAGERATASVRIPKGGAVEFYCRYHRRAGMVGKLRAGTGQAPAKDSAKSFGY